MRSSQLLSRPVGEMLREIDEDVVQDEEDVEMTTDRGDGALWSIGTLLRHFPIYSRMKGPIGMY